jgi:hypothetical protein
MEYNEEHSYKKVGGFHVKKLYSLLCVIGGVLWGAKPVYDWLVLDRNINTGLTIFDWTDFIKFAFPLLCVGGVLGLLTLYKKHVKLSAIILFISLILNALFHFAEIYLTHSPIPFGLLFLLTGSITLLVGSTMLVFQLKKVPSIPYILSFLAVGLTVTTFLFCLLPFISNSLIDSLETPIMVGLMMFNGLFWALIGGVLFQIIRSKEMNTDLKQKHSHY